MIELFPLTEVDIEVHNAGEDEDAVRWHSGGRATTESTRRHFATLAQNAADGTGKRGFGVRVDGRLAGYVDCDPDSDATLAIGDVSISYSVHPWARRRGVATAAVDLICTFITGERIGARAIIRADPRNTASIGVARSSGFKPLDEPPSVTGPDNDAGAFLTFVREL